MMLIKDQQDRVILTEDKTRLMNSVNAIYWRQQTDIGGIKWSILYTREKMLLNERQQMMLPKEERHLQQRKIVFYER